MSKIAKFITLDIFSVKTEVRPIQVVLALVISAIGFFFMGGYGIALGFLPLVNIFISAPFAVGDNGLDSLYVTLFISRKNVVVGRYTYAFAIHIALVCVYFATGMIASGIAGTGLNAISLLAMLLGVFIVATTINAVTIPVMFKIGYRQAKSLVNMLPLLVVAGSTLLMRFHADASYDVTASLSDTMSDHVFGMESVTLVVAIFVTWVAVMIVSYLVSLRFYAKRYF